MKMTSVSDELSLLKSYLSYDEDTGNLYWIKVNNNKRKSGEIAGNKTKSGYIQIGLYNKRYLAHRVAFLFSYGRWPALTDHINRNRADNRIENLREISDHASNINKRPHRSPVSGFRGAYYRKGCPFRPYKAQARMSDGRIKFLGYYATPEEAQAAYLEHYKSQGIEIDLKLDLQTKGGRNGIRNT
jgi:hypothetical protein